MGIQVLYPSPDIYGPLQKGIESSICLLLKI